MCSINTPEHIQQGQKGFLLCGGNNMGELEKHERFEMETLNSMRRLKVLDKLIFYWRDDAEVMFWITALFG